MAEYTSLEPGDWCVIAADSLGVTIDAHGRDGEALADKMAPSAQQEWDAWPGLETIIYMLVEPEHAEYALLAERSKPPRG
jgi:hypothetical protein